MYELKKNKSNMAVVILVFILFILSAALPLFFVHDYDMYSFSKGKETKISGVKAIKARKEKYKKIQGSLSTKRLNEVLAFYKKLPDKDESDIIIDGKYPGLYQLLRVAYAPIGEEDSFQLRKIKNTNYFYKLHREKIKEQATNSKVPIKERGALLKYVSKMKQTFKIEFVEQWPVLLKSMHFVYMIIAFLAVIISNQLFSFEKETHMDLILNSMDKKRLMLIGVKKILSMSFYLSLVFVLCTAIVSLITFSIGGISGWNSQIQMMADFFLVPYNWNFGELYIYFIFVAWISIMAIAFTGTLLNAMIQKTYPSLILTGVILLIPKVLCSSDYVPYVVRKIALIQPANGISIFSYLDKLFQYQIGSFFVLPVTAIVLSAIAYIVICAVVAPWMFQLRIQEKEN
ncbi:MAG: hypothetical protein PHD70_02420 [Anaerostipes sp.]|jgi:hypothetical protein|nr:hypothetical protein [Anaerostipes sp.]MDD3745311.1 hypothetical protein [Anaerostipes sp.]